MNGYTFFQSYYKALRTLPDELRLAIRDAVDDYMFEGTEPAFLDPIATAVFELMRPTLDTSKERGKSGRTKSNEEQKESNEIKRNQKKSKWNQKESNEIKSDFSPPYPYPYPYPTPNNNKTILQDKDKECGGEDKKTSPPRTRFTPPSISEVEEYCKERSNNVDAQHWFDYYSSNGWKVGKNPMKDWKAAVRTWERNEYGGKSNARDKPAPGWGEHDDPYAAYRTQRDGDEGQRSDPDTRTPGPYSDGPFQ